MCYYSPTLRRPSVRDGVRTPAGKLPPIGSCHQAATYPSTTFSLFSCNLQFHVTSPQFAFWIIKIGLPRYSISSDALHFKIRCACYDRQDRWAAPSTWLGARAGLGRGPRAQSLISSSLRGFVRKSCAHKYSCKLLVLIKQKKSIVSGFPQGTERFICAQTLAASPPPPSCRAPPCSHGAPAPPMSSPSKP
jgi:hypothetical protein